MRLNRESYDMSQYTSLSGDNHLLNNTFGGIYEFIELLYHLTHIFLCYRQAYHNQENLPSILLEFDNLHPYDFIISLFLQI